MEQLAYGITLIIGYLCIVAMLVAVYSLVTLVLSKKAAYVVMPILVLILAWPLARMIGLFIVRLGAG